jgi:hypothetical protein
MHLHIARGLTIAAAVVVAVVVLACGAARAAAPSPVETGRPSDLINTPVCAVVESFDDPRNCGAFSASDLALHRTRANHF